jgi:hypothetical protein
MRVKITSYDLQVSSPIPAALPESAEWRRKAASINGELSDWLLQPIPWRIRILALLSRHMGVFQYATKLKLHSIQRPEYGHCLLQAAQLARRLGHSRISAIEFGVAGGNGLVALERHAAYVTRQTGIEVAIYGFDTGEGDPEPRDYRDLPYLFQGGSFVMDRDRLRRRLQAAKLLLGSVEETVPTFMKQNHPPIGFISFDMDYYSSTMAALKIFESAENHLLPRVACYFGSMVGGIDRALSEFTGQSLAIKEFNTAHDNIKVAPVQGLRFYNNWLPRTWHEQILVAHLFRHPDYCRPIYPNPQAPLADPDGWRHPSVRA